MKKLAVACAASDSQSPAGASEGFSSENSEFLLPETLKFFTRVKLTVKHLPRLQFEPLRMGEHAPQASQVIISSSRTPGGGRVQVYQNFSLFCNTIRNVGRFGLWWGERSTDVFILNMVVDPTSTRAPGNSAYTNAHRERRAQLRRQCRRRASHAKHEPKGEAGRCRDAFVSPRRPVPTAVRYQQRERFAHHITQRNASRYEL